MSPKSPLNRSARSQVAPFRAMAVLAAANAREARGQEVFHLEVGEPGAPLPAPVAAAIAQRLATAPLGYTEALGMPALRRAISGLYADWYGAVVPAERIAVTVGASGGFVLAFLAAFDQGARIGIAEPGYPAYKTMAHALDLVPVPIAAERRNAFQPTPFDLDRVRPLDGLVLASPANPTGAVLSPQALDRLIEVGAEARIRLLVDEIYHGLVFDQPQVTAATRAPDAIVVNSFSKYFGLTGWRVGWLVLPEALVEPVERLAQNLFISPPAMAQNAALAALAHKDLFADRRQAYAANWRRLASGLAAAGVAEAAIVPADGAFYLYADLGDFTADTGELCQRLLDETGVAATPGCDFDPARGDRFVRFSVAGAPPVIDAASQRLADWLPAQRRNRRD